jgi:thiol-disulfide isomerase/thioredoxin
MKRFSLYLLAISLFAAVYGAESTGVIVEKSLTFEQVKAKALQESKFILMDCYASWCGPCKWMDKYIFSDPEVGKFYNANYVTCSYDMEKGEGLQLAKQFQIRNYPTFLIFSPAGELVHRGLGSMPAEDFIKLGKDGMNPETQYVSLRKQYNGSTTHTDEFLIKFCYAAAAAQDDSLAQAALQEYLAKQRNVDDPATIQMLYDLTHSASDIGFQHLFVNKPAAIKVLGEDAYNAFIEDMIYNEGRKKGKLGNGTADFTAYVKQYLPEKADMLTAEYELSNLKRAGKWKDYPALAEKFVKQYAWNDAERLNAIAWNIYENVSDKAELAKALAWALRAADLKNTHEINDTVAHLYLANGNDEKARKYTMAAIDQAKSHGESTTDLEEFLKSIK